MSETETVALVLQRIEEIPRINLTPQTFMAEMKKIEPIKRVYISRPGVKGNSIEFGVVIALWPEEEGEPQRFIARSLTERFSES